MFRSFNLILAVLWACLGTYLLTWDRLAGKVQVVLPIGEGVSAGWLALVLAVYNFLRWWVAFNNRHAASHEAEPLALRNHPRRRRENRDDEEPNPAFDFSQRSQPPPGP